ncbi:MAG: type II secretion system F family protein [Candidatus Nanopelagicales bacterium]
MAAVAAAMFTSLAVWLAWGPAQLPTGAGARSAAAQGAGLAGRVRGRFRRVPADLLVGELLSALAAELAAGQPLVSALLAAADGLEPCPCPNALRAASLGADVAPALRRDAREAESRVLGGLAACWEVAADSGVGMSLAVGRLARSERETRAAQADLRAELATTIATGRLLAALPLAGLGMGHWLGAEPLRWLLTGWPGLAVLATGIALEVVAVLWLRAIVAEVRRAL